MTTTVHVGPAENAGPRNAETRVFFWCLIWDRLYMGGAACNYARSARRVCAQNCACFAKSISRVFLIALVYPITERLSVLAFLHVQLIK